MTAPTRFSRVTSPRAAQVTSLRDTGAITRPGNPSASCRTRLKPSARRPARLRTEPRPVPSTTGPAAASCCRSAAESFFRAAATAARPRSDNARPSMPGPGFQPSGGAFSTRPPRAAAISTAHAAPHVREPRAGRFRRRARRQRPPPALPDLLLRRRPVRELRALPTVRVEHVHGQNRRLRPDRLRRPPLEHVGDLRRAVPALARHRVGRRRHQERVRPHRAQAGLRARRGLDPLPHPRQRVLAARHGDLEAEAVGDAGRERSRPALHVRLRLAGAFRVEGPRTQAPLPYANRLTRRIRGPGRRRLARRRLARRPAP